MSEKNNAFCSICGNGYYVCKSCNDSVKLSPWKMYTDSAEHYKVFQIIRGFSTGVYSKDEAKEKFKNVDLSDVESFRPHIKQIVKDIVRENEPVVEPIIEVSKSIEETPVVDEVKPVAEIDVKAINRNKRSYKFGSAE